VGKDKEYFLVACYLLKEKRPTLCWAFLSCHSEPLAVAIL